MNDTTIPQPIFDDGSLIDATPDAIRVGFGTFVTFMPNAWEVAVKVDPWLTSFSGHERVREVLLALRTCIEHNHGRIGPSPLGFSIPLPDVDSDSVNLLCDADIRRGGGLSLTIGMPHEL